MSRTLTEEQLTPYHVIAYDSGVNPLDDEFIPPKPDKKRDGPLVRNKKFEIHYGLIIDSNVV